VELFNGKKPTVQKNEFHVAWRGVFCYLKYESKHFRLYQIQPLVAACQFSLGKKKRPWVVFGKGEYLLFLKKS